MADFQTHIATSSAIGLVYGTAGFVHWDMDPPSCIVAAGLCSVAGIFPDVDSDSGLAQREVLGFAAAVIPMLLLPRFEQMGLTHSATAAAGACIYVIIRFGIGEILQRITVHRGMWHSIPAAAIAGLFVSMLCSNRPDSIRIFEAFAMVLGYLTHLGLDEMWAIEWRRGRFRFKKSFGTALKFFGDGVFPNLFTYAMLLLATASVANDPRLESIFGIEGQQIQRVARRFVDDYLGHERDHGILRH